MVPRSLAADESATARVHIVESTSIHPYPSASLRIPPPDWVAGFCVIKHHPSGIANRLAGLPTAGEKRDLQ